jgi:hypothetical protein
MHDQFPYRSSFFPPKINTIKNQHTKTDAYLCSNSSCINECSASTAKEKDRNSRGSCLYKEPYGGGQNISREKAEGADSVQLSEKAIIITNTPKRVT